jgi:hypothetical protein
MKTVLVQSIVEAIKIDLTTSNLTQKQIAEKHGTTPMIINRINVGAVYSAIEPKTEPQKKRESLKERYNNSTKSKTWPPSINHEPMKLTITSQDEFVDLITHVKTKGFPNVIYIDSEDKETLEWSIEYLKARQRKLEIKLSKVRLMIDAIEREDFTDLPPSCLKELEDNINEIKAKTLLQESNQGQPQ